MTRRVKEQAKNTKELSISHENNQQSVYEIEGLRCLIAEFLEDVRDKIIFLFRLSKSLAIDSKITGNLNLYPYRYVITSRVFKDLMNKTLRLKEVSLSECKQLVNDDIEALVKQHASVTSLSLRGAEFTDEGLAVLALYLGKLTSLNLRSHQKITDEGLKVLAKNCRNLTSLKLNLCLQITDEGLEALAPSLRNLTSLDLSFCLEITNEGLKALAENCKNLTSLNLQNCSQITDEGLAKLAPSLGYLTNLNLSYTEITDEGLA
ncbi:MAG TPA: hypothetical protein QF873_04240, partial [Patescibacteria group bacterium]|nr:hypothetical protein [Patescibacteria group bacterium]